MCRRWNWRNGDITKITVDSDELVINIDCLPPVGEETGKTAQAEMVMLLEKYCDAKAVTGTLSTDNRELVLG